ncbi:DinB family protein [Neobacillus endophyticus]|uniref:DinB family protein n=1 Tax=Neobacillus endophyticus TaxID=2738405 RepID=UPI001C277B4F|nr:DinB family protein [Neobacillus endophyticus]
MSFVDVLLQEYEKTTDLIKKAISGLNENELSWKEAAEKWSVKEVLSHLLDHNLITSFRLAESNATLPAFNQDRWVKGTRANEGLSYQILDSFQSLLALNLQVFHRLTNDDWYKKGTNSKGETVQLYEIVNLFIKHVQHHIKQIERIKSSLPSLFKN